MKIWLDDERPAPEGWIRTAYADVTIHLLAYNDVSEVSLDHDLGDHRIETGYDVVAWIEREVFINPDYKPPKINVHSANPPARKRMEAAARKINEISAGSE